MDLPENNSVLSINNSFYKVFKTLKDKRSKNESTAKEVEWIQSQLLSENSRICENGVNVLISSCGAGIEVGFALNSLVSSLPRLAANYEIVADGIIKLLLLDVDRSDYRCPFGIQNKPHPLLLLIDDSNEKMLYLSLKIAGIIKSSSRFVNQIKCFNFP